MTVAKYIKYRMLSGCADIDHCAISGDAALDSEPPELDHAGIHRIPTICTVLFLILNRTRILRYRKR